MNFLYEKLIELAEHLKILDEVFHNQNYYTNPIDYDIYIENFNRLKDIAKNSKVEKSHGIKSTFDEEIYSISDRQMKLADIIEYILYSRGVYFLFQGNKFKEDRISDYIEINLRIVNILMSYESITSDEKLRGVLLISLKNIIGDEPLFDKLLNSKNTIGQPGNIESKELNEYFDSILPKTAGGLWHEILVYCFILKYNIGYIFPLLLTQKPISLKHKLSPPDLVVLQNNTYRYYGIEIGNLKERQSGGFMAPSGIPVIPIDTKNARISDRCPACSKWIGICPKVIDDFSNTSTLKPINEIRCLTDCEKFTLKEKLNGDCKYMKFSYKNQNWKFKSADGKHYHYNCVKDENNSIGTSIKDKINHVVNIIDSNAISNNSFNLPKDNRSKVNYLKTHSIYYSELLKLIDTSNI